MKPAFVVSVGSLATCLIVAWAGGLSAHGEPSTAAASYQSTEWVTYAELERVPPNDKWPQSVHELAEAAADLVDLNKDALLGSYIADNGDVVVVSGTPAGTEIVDNRFPKSEVVVRDAPVTVETAAEIGFAIQKLSPGLAESIFMWGGKPQIGGMFVAIRTDLRVEERQMLEEFSAERRLPLLVELNIGTPLPQEDVESRWHDLDPYVGGSAYELVADDSYAGDTDGTCSFGFAFRQSDGDEFMLTAGHCLPTGTAHKYAWTYLSTAGAPFQYAGWRTTTTWENGTGTILTDDNQLHGDLALIKLPTNRNANARIWWGGKDATGTIPVVARQAPIVGDPTCINGANSGSDCGTRIQDVNITVEFAGNWLRNGDRATALTDHDCSVGGDSGGSVVFNHAGPEEESGAVGIGIIKGHISGGNCQQFFTGVEEASQAWGGGLQFSS